jgi:alanine racemase
LVELKVNTGMNRNGINMNELDEAFKLIKTYGLELEAVFTHHGCADEINEFYELQKNNFAKVKEISMELTNKHGFKSLRFHSCNSAALFRERDFNDDMARVGIAAYGCMELPEEINKVEFKPVLSLYAKKISSRTLNNGDAVGYGATFKAQKSCNVGNYDFGYGDGFLRSASNNYKTPKGVELIGRISMDNSSFLSEDDELLVFDDAREVSKSANTISYEVLTSLKPSIKRKII